MTKMFQAYQLNLRMRGVDLKTLKCFWQSVRAYYIQVSTFFRLAAPYRKEV